MLKDVQHRLTPLNEGVDVYRGLIDGVVFIGISLRALQLPDAVICSNDRSGKVASADVEVSEGNLCKGHVA